MTSAEKHTAGPAVVSLYGSFRTLVRSGDEQTGRKIAITWVGMTNPKRGPDESRDAYHERCRTTELERARQNEANAEFIAEAFTVAHETGLTPRQLADAYTALRDGSRIAVEAWKVERDELVKALSDVVSLYVELVDSGDAGFWDAEKVDEVIAARAAIAKAEAATLARCSSQVEEG